ncbi:MAG TPA: hypothetical protein VGT98_10875 [Candidatus Elarobacter sp.]|nr:hypothetical protein [Candidatus Elarobacter sp.]HEV2741187.1 hypothetical protein [Candidatus Elarobacter sp.]
MRPFRPTWKGRLTGHVSEELKELADRIAEAYGITPLAPGERRPPGYYSVRWSTRWKPLPPPKPRDDKR